MEMKERYSDMDQYLVWCLEDNERAEKIRKKLEEWGLLFLIEDPHEATRKEVTKGLGVFSII